MRGTRNSKHKKKEREREREHTTDITLPSSDHAELSLGIERIQGLSIVGFWCHVGIPGMLVAGRLANPYCDFMGRVKGLIQIKITKFSKLLKFVSLFLIAWRIRCISGTILLKIGFWEVFKK